jgi:hypothetical protein
LIEFIEDLKTFDETLNCSRYLRQGGDYPLIAISFPDEDNIACDKLHSIIEVVPRAEGRLHLAKRWNGSEGVKMIVSFTSHAPPMTRVIENSQDIISFVKDYLHKSFSNWSIMEVEEITWRQFGVLVYIDQLQVIRAQIIGARLGDHLCFILLTPVEFREWFPDVVIDDNEFPAFVIVNNERTRFKLVKNINFKDEYEKVKGLLNVTNEAEYDMLYHQPRKRAEEQMVTDFPTGIEQIKDSGIWILALIVLVLIFVIAIMLGFMKRPRMLLRQLHKTIQRHVAHAVGKTAAFEA